jgi:hypothetical protein
MVVGRQKAGGLGEGGSGGGTSMTLVTGDGNGEGEAMGCSRFQRERWGGGEADDTVKSDMTPGEAEGYGWHLEVKDDQRKLGWLVECAIGLNC